MIDMIVFDKLENIKDIRANEILHSRNIPFINIDFGVDLLSLHNNLISYSVCHCYDDVLYCYCEN